jgi:hypothetical protein
LVNSLLGESSGQEYGLTKEEEQYLLDKENARKEAELAGQYQKQSDRKGDVQKVLDRIKKVMPKVKVVVDENLDAAGRVQGNTLTINPYYAGIDTPIHEAGHILIDAIGYKNKVVQAGIAQLKNTDLWKETKERYPELSDEMLGKEVLAEAIGREGANIFDTESDKNRFKAVLSYIFDKIKQLLGIDKNVAKSLAKQIIGGIGTKELVGSSNEEQLAKKKATPLSTEDKALRDLVKIIDEEPDLYLHSADDLLRVVRMIDAAQTVDSKTKSVWRNKLRKRIALNLQRRFVESSASKVSQSDISHKDITRLNVFMKVLDHFSDAFPEMKEFSKMYEEAYFKKMKVTEEAKNTHIKLAEQVIKERNKKLGIVQKVKEIALQSFIDQKHKYFGFLDNGKGKLLTLDEAKSKGLSADQMEYLKFARDVITQGNDIGGELEVPKINKGVGEALQTEGLVSGMASLITNNDLNNVRIKFTNPITGNTQITEFKNIKATLSSYASKGIKERAKALSSLFKYTINAKSQFKTGHNEDGGKQNWPITKSGKSSLDENGKIRSRMGERNNANLTYSNDFYNALNQYIDDSIHIQTMSPLVPVIESIQYLAKTGIADANGNISHDKPRLAKYIQGWTDLHLWKKQEETPFDKPLQFLRWLTSVRMMLFNVTAQGFNLAVGTYNNWVAMDSKDFIKGQLRVFGGTKRSRSADYGFGMTNKYMMDIARKYHAVSVDMDSNPLRTTSNYFSALGFAGLKWGEILIQSSGLAGRLSDSDYNSFEYKPNKYGVDELVVKSNIGAKEKAELEERIRQHINAVSDLQGKYSEKDRRNIMNNELGKSVMQFKVWMPDWWRVRMGEEGRYKVGAKTAWDVMTGNASQELRDAIKKDGIVKHFWEDKVFMSNLKGAMTVGLLMSLLYTGDDDDRKSAASKAMQRFLSDVLFIFDPNNLKFTVTRPVGSVSTLEAMIDALDHLFAFESDDFYKGKSKYGEAGESKLRGDFMKLTPAGKIANAVETFTPEED